MQRPIGVVLSAGVQILGSLFVLLMSVVIFAAPHLAPSSGRQPQPPAGFFVTMGVVYLMFAGISIGTAIGLIQLKNWSRYSTLMFAGFLVFVGLVSMLVSAVAPFTPPPNQAAQLPPSFAIKVRIFAIAFSFAIAALGGVWLYYFNRRSIRSAFAGEKLERETDRRPLSVVVLAGLSFLGVRFNLFCIWMGTPAMVLGLLVEGNAARLSFLVLLAISLYLGIGLLRLTPASRKIAIGFYVFGIINIVLAYALPGREQRWAHVLAESNRVWHVQNATYHAMPAQAGLWAGMAGGFAFSAVAIYFLVAHRAAFEHHATTPPTHPPIVAA